MEVKYSEYPCLITVDEQLAIIDEAIETINKKKVICMAKDASLFSGLCRILTDIIYTKYTHMVIEKRLTDFGDIERFLPLFKHENAVAFANAIENTTANLFWWPVGLGAHPMDYAYDFNNRIAFLEWMRSELKETALFGPRY